MFKLKIGIVGRQRNLNKELVEKQIAATIQKNGIVISTAKTVKEICATSNYNRSVEIPIYNTQNLKSNKFS